MSLADICLALTAISAVLFAQNLFLFRRLPLTRKRTGVSVLIPARNEEGSIGGALESVLASEDVELEVVVLDDGSVDGTADAVRRVAAKDGRVRLVSAPPLPEGWCGKQHACYVLSQHAGFDVLCFMDADVRLTPDALARMAGSDVDLLSGFPRQETETFLERLLIPQIHFVLLGYLPMLGLRFTRHPGFAAGCGQLMMVRRHAYQQSGGHAAIRSTLHDGILLPRLLRQHGFRTDIFDATDTARCRMYRSAGEVWTGLMKNAVEGMAAPARLPVFTILLVGGHVALLHPAAAVLSIGMRLIAAWRFRQPVGSALLHPFGVLVLLALQWYALARHLLRRPATWKGREYARCAQSASPIPEADSAA